MEYGRTPGIGFANDKSVKQSVSIENVAYPLRAWWGKTRCETVGKVGFVCRGRRWSNLHFISQS